MAKPTFNLFGPITKDDIRVGYISTDRGYVEGRSICDANLHAQKNPGAVFIFKPDRTTVEFLSINEVNKLDPSTADTTISCPDGLKLEGEPDPPSVQFLGGGGIGAVANPVIGNDGSVMAIDLVNGGYGYQYPPIVKLKDDRGLGVGAIINVGLGTIADQTIYYADEEDFEEVRLCPDPFTDPSKSDGGKESKDASKRSEYGRRFGPSGKDLGAWRPRTYTEDKKIPFEDVLDDYLKKLAVSGKDWWTTRKEPPLRVNTDGKQSRTVYDVSHWAWGGGTATALSDVEFEIYWHSPGRTTGLGFEFVAQDGSHSFIIGSGTKTIGQGRTKSVFQVKENVTYNVKPIGKKSKNMGPLPKASSSTAPKKLNVGTVNELANQGLLKKLGGTAGKDITKFKQQAVGTGDKIFADFLASGDDADDIQVQANRGKFTASNQRWVKGTGGRRQTYDLTYRFQTGKVEVAPSFMNRHAISPVPPSNVKGSDNSGKWYSFEWDVDFPYDGEYKFRAQCDNKARLYIDNKQLSSFQIGFGGASGHVLSSPSGLKETVEGGLHKMRLDLYNESIKQQLPISQPPPASTSEVIFKIVGSSWFTDGVRIEELDINEVKDFTFSDTKGQLNKSYTRKIDFGRKYKVVFTSKESLNVELRTKGLNVIQMENAGDGSFDDVVISASTGQFTDLKGNVAYFSVPYPEKKGNKSESSQGIKTKQIFNTVDYINKANRQLWRTNIFAQGGFLNDNGVCPFDTNLQLKDNPYAGTHTINWPNVNFPIDGNYTIDVAVDDNVKLKIGDQVNIDKKGFKEGTSVSTGTLRVTRFIKQGTYPVIAELEQIAGGAFSFKAPDGNIKKALDVKFKVTSASMYANKITIPGLLSVGKQYKGSQISQILNKKVEVNKDYDVILNSDQSTNIRLRIKDDGKRLEMEDWKDGDWQDMVCTVTQGEFHSIQGSRCKFRINQTVKGSNPMALAINIESSFSEKEVDAQKSWNENPMGVALTIDSPIPPIPQEPVPLQEGRCPNNPFWTTRFPGAKERWFPVKHNQWGDLLNKHGISPTIPFNKTTNPLIDVSFEVQWNSPHRNSGLGYRFVAQDGSHSFTIRDISKTVSQGQRIDKIKVKENITYDVKVIGRRSASQGSINDARGDNSKVTELAEQGLLKTMGKTKGGNLPKLDGGSGDIIFADFLDSLDDADDIQIQAGVGKFTSSNPRKVNALKGQRTTYDLTYRVDKVPSMETGSFSNSWTKDFPFGGYYKALLEVDDIGELWIDDEKVIDRKVPGKEEKLIYIDGPTSQEEFDSKGPTSHTIKVVAQNTKSEKTKEIDAKIFNTLDWIGGGSSSPTYKTIKFKVSTASLYGNGIKIPELGIAASKKYNGANVNKTFEREVEVNKVYDVELTSNATPPGLISRDIIFQGLHPVNNPIQVNDSRRRMNLKDGHGTDSNASFIIESGDVRFSADGKSLEGSGESTITLTWNDKRKAGRAIDKITIANITWTRSGTRGTESHKITIPGNTSRAAGVRLRTSGESVLQMEDHTDSSWDDVQCSATEGRFFDFKPGANNASCKFVVTAATKVSGGVAGGTTREGVTYQGPHLFHFTHKLWGKVINKEGISPIGSPNQSLSEPNSNILGTKILTWKNVNFPESGEYDILFVADDIGELYIGDSSIPKIKVTQNHPTNEYATESIKLTKGKHDISVHLTNLYTNDLFQTNPTGVALKITKKMAVGTGIYRTWKENPLGISAKLIPPPCPKKVSGKGVVVDPVVVDPGNGYPPGGGGGYPAALKLKDAVILNGGINYDQDKDTVTLLDPITGDSNGAKLSLCEVGPFGQIEKVCIDAPGFFDRMPTVVVDSDTGVNLDLSLQFEVVRDPVVEDLPLVQVTDLVGLKQTGYYRGRPYYGAVFYQDGVKYAGWYETAGELVQIYETMQESIDARVTTPPSAILRQGSDTSSNDPRLNIPGTPENLT